MDLMLHVFSVMPNTRLVIIGDCGLLHRFVFDTFVDFYFISDLFISFRTAFFNEIGELQVCADPPPPLPLLSTWLFFASLLSQMHLSSLLSPLLPLYRFAAFQASHRRIRGDRLTATGHLTHTEPAAPSRQEVPPDVVFGGHDELPADQLHHVDRRGAGRHRGQRRLERSQVEQVL